MGRHSAYESVETVVLNLAYMVALRERSATSFFKIKNIAKKRVVPFARIAKFCQEMEIPSSAYLGTLLAGPVDTRRKIEGFVLTVEWLASRSAQVVFVERMESYKKRLGSLDKVFDYVAGRSPGSTTQLFGDSFPTAYWLFHRLLDNDELTDDVVLKILVADDALSPAFVATSAVVMALPRASKEYELVKTKAGPEMDLMRVREIRPKFLFGRERALEAAKTYLGPWQDGRWEALWKTLT